MKIAVTYDNGQIFQHFGHTQQFKLYDIQDNKIIGTEILDSGDFGHESLTVLHRQKGVELLICGGIGGGAQNALASVGIRHFGGCQGDADANVEAYLNGALNYDPNAVCSDHDHHHHGEEHTCGSSGGSCQH